MHTAREKEALLLQIACLEGQVQQIARDWEQLGQWVETDQALLTAVQEHTEQVQALLVTAGTRDPQVQRAFTELVIIGHIQAFLLEQTIQREAHKRLNLEEEEGQVYLSAVALRQYLCLEGFPGEPAREVKGPLERSVSIESSEELLLVLRHGPVGKDRAEALQDLAELYPEDLPLALVLRLFWQDPDLDVRLAAAWLLSMLGARAPIEDLVAAFLSAAEPPDLRVQLAEMLVHLGTQPALEALAAAVHDPVIAVRAAAVNACASISGWIPLESLTAALGDSAPQVRSAAALGLGKRLDRGLLDPDAIVVPLVGTLSDPISQVRLAVVQTFAAFGSQAPIEALLDALQDPEPEVRGAAVETLGALVEETATRPRAQTFVLEALGDSESQVRERAIEVLVAYPEYAPLAALHAATRDPHHPWKRGAAAVTLAKLGNLGPLEGALHDPDPQVRRLAAEALEIVRAAHHAQEPQDNR